MTTLALTNLPVADSWNMPGGWGWGWMVPMMLGMVLFWGAVIFGVIWLVRDASERRPRRHDESALEILDRRFAEGALSVDEYHERRDVLAGSPVTEGGSR